MLYWFWPLYLACRFGEVEVKLLSQYWRLSLLDTFLSQVTCCLEGDSTGSVGEWALLNTLYKRVQLEQGISASLSPRESSRRQSCACVCEKQRHITAAWDEKGIFHSYTCQQEWHWHLALFWCLSAENCAKTESLRKGYTERRRN